MRIIVGVTGATGVEMSYYLLKALRSTKDCEIHLVVSQGALTTWQLESRIPLSTAYGYRVFRLSLRADWMPSAVLAG